MYKPETDKMNREKDNNNWVWYTLAIVIWIGMFFLATGSYGDATDYPEDYNEYEDCGRWC